MRLKNKEIRQATPEFSGRETAVALPPREQYADEIAKLTADLIRFDTSNPPGNETACAQFLLEKFLAEGIEAEVIEGAQGRGNLVARIRGNGEAPSFLLLSHLDVAPAHNAKQWTHPPFAGVIDQDQVWGRGAIDLKGRVAMDFMAMALIARLKLPLGGDLLFAAVADEKVRGPWGTSYLLRERPETLSARYAIGEGGGFPAQLGHALVYIINAGEKGLLWLKLSFSGVSGHSSMPLAADNALVKAASAARALQRHRPARKTTDLVRRSLAGILEAQMGWRGRLIARLLLRTPFGVAIFESLARRSGRRGPLDATLRMTLSPNGISADGETNTVPGTASLICDCRMLPGQTETSVYKELAKIGIHSSNVAIEVLRHYDASTSSVDNELYVALADTLRELAPGSVVVPYLLPTASDNGLLRAQGTLIYGFQPLAPDEDPEAALRVHGIDERISIRSLTFGTEAIMRAIFKTIGQQGCQSNE